MSVSAPPRDLERITSFWMAAKATGRVLCVSPTTMTYLREFEGEQGFPLINDPNIAVLMLPKGKANINELLGPARDVPPEREEPKEEDEEMPRHLIDADYRFHERAYLRWKRWKNTERIRQAPQQDLFEIVVKDKTRRRRQKVTLNDIRRYPESFIVMMEPNQMIPMLTAIAGSKRSMPKNSRHVNSHPEGWNAEMKVGDTKKANVMEAFGMYEGPQPDYFLRSKPDPIIRYNHQVHVPGHMNTRENEERLNRSDCTKIIYHTLEPQRVVRIIRRGKAFVPERGVPFTLERQTT
jgi:hypothetical protein